MASLIFVSSGVTLVADCIESVQYIQEIKDNEVPISGVMDQKLPYTNQNQNSARVIFIMKSGRLYYTLELTKEVAKTIYENTLKVLQGSLTYKQL